jgi:hypothetical protein
MRNAKIEYHFQMILKLNYGCGEQLYSREMTQFWVLHENELSTLKYFSSQFHPLEPHGLQT